MEHLKLESKERRKKAEKMINEFKQKQIKNGYKEVITKRGNKGEIYLQWVKIK